MSLEALRGPGEMGFIVADGLSALAVHRQAPKLLCEMKADISAASVTPVIVVEQGRVAIGERPGLSSPDSLGIYLTWAPRKGRTDAERNCISTSATAV